MKGNFLKKIALCICACVSISALSCQNVSSADMEISAVSAIVIESRSGRVIYEKNAYEKRQMASTTKIMSTLLALEQQSLDEYFVVDKDAIKVEGSSMGLKEGDMVTLRALCYGMMLPSGNDSANACAVKIAGSIDKFVEKMNEKAQEIGLSDTHFVTPSGLDDDTEEHYSTAYDMAKLTAYAMKNEAFCEICSQSKAKVTFGNPPYDRWLTNNNKLLNMCDGVIGVKTGFTDKARRCLVSACKRNDTTLICVTLNAPDDWNDHAKLYDYAFSKVKSYALPCEFGQLNVNLVGADSDFAKVQMERTPTAVLFSDELARVKAEVLLNRFYYAPVTKGEKLGVVNFYVDDRLVESVNLVCISEQKAVKPKEKSTLKRIVNNLKEKFISQ